MTCTGSRFCNPVGARIVCKVGTRRRKRRAIRVRKRPGGEVRELSARLVRKLVWPQNSKAARAATKEARHYPTNDSRRAPAPPNCFWLSNFPYVTDDLIHNPSGHRPQENPNTAFTVCKADPIRSWISTGPRPRRPRDAAAERGATLHAEEWLLPLAMACDLESESSVSYQPPLALS